jgi:hemolysin-activating ACP:hemolysin acyltransferase
MVVAMRDIGLMRWALFFFQPREALLKYAHTQDDQQWTSGECAPLFLLFFSVFALSGFWLPRAEEGLMFI